MPFNGAVASDQRQVNTSSLPYEYDGGTFVGNIITNSDGTPFDVSQFVSFNLFTGLAWQAGTTPNIENVPSIDIALDWWIPNPKTGLLIYAGTDIYEIGGPINVGDESSTLLSGTIKGTNMSVRIAAINAVYTNPGILNAILNLSTVPTDRVRSTWVKANAGQGGDDHLGPVLSGNIASSGNTGLQFAYPMRPDSDIMLRMGSDTAGGKIEYRFQWGNGGNVQTFVVDVLQSDGYQYLTVPAPNRPLLVNVFNGIAAIGKYTFQAWAQGQ